MGIKLTEFKLRFISSIRSVVEGREKMVLEKSVSRAPDSYCILEQLKMVAEELFRMFIL